MKYFRVDVVAVTPNPQQVIWAAMHQDYAEEYVWNGRDRWPHEEQSGELIVKHLLSGDRGHYGPLEHPQITVNVGYFPHSMMQQLRTHRVGVSFDVQCLAADTEITFVNCEGETSQKLKKTIGELYDIWTNGEKAIRERSIRGRNGEPLGEYRRDCKKRIRKMRLRVLNEETGLFEVGYIKDVMCSGMQPVYRVTLEDGKTLDCTVNHRLFTSEGWQTMGDAVGLVTNPDGSVVKMTKPCDLMCNGMAVAGAGLYRNKIWLQEQITKGLSTEEIAELSCCSITAVKDWARKYQLSLNKRDTRFSKGQQPWNYRSDALYRNKIWLEEQLSKGLHVDEMANLANCSIEAIKKWVYVYGLSLNKRPTGAETPWNKGKGGYKLNLSEESRQKRVEDAKKHTKRGENSNFWKGGTSTDRELIGAWTRQIAPQVHKKFDYICQRCGHRGGTLHAHHLVPVFADESLAYEFDNLVTLCKECHEYIHQNNKEAELAESYKPILEPQNWQLKPKPIGNIQAHPVKIKSVEYLGEQITYDLEVEGSWHNFVANGMVVHNSFRYTGQRVVDVVEGKLDIEEVFYMRPVGNYTNRQGKRYFYSEEQRQDDLQWCLDACKHYKKRIDEGLSEEHARSIIPFDARQHFVLSCNVRSLLHLLDLRWKKDAQLEAQKFCELIWVHFEEWTPAIAKWYSDNRAHKAKLAP